METATRTPELASYEAIASVLGCTYRTLKKRLTEAAIEPVSQQGRSILFSRLEVVESIAGEDSILTIKEQLRDAAYGRTPRQAMAETRLIIEDILHRLGELATPFTPPAFLLHHLPGYRPATEAELDSDHYQNPYSDLASRLWPESERHRLAISPLRKIRITRPPSDPVEHCRQALYQFQAKALPAIDRHRQELATIAENDSRLKMDIIDRLLTRARREIENFVSAV